MSQLRLPLQRREGARRVEFIVGDANLRVVHALEHWGTWPVMAALLVGPRKSGRTLLARLFRKQTGGEIIDDAERASETAIFHAWNLAQADRRPLLIVADVPPPDWRVALPDLRSRLAATPVLRIDEPDDALFAAILADQFDRRELDARADVLAWIARRSERNYLTLQRIVDAIEAQAYERDTRRISIPLARAALQAAGLMVQMPPEPGREEA
ncbi:P-loop NTPase family protein [Sphingomonas baiyangensis]|uniref:Chromosomal replication initiator DnaA n=1 Tax=Sphingomonas baiyangensis TaxID=2572576 RepID=A0A4U1L3W6_9SPHN|nr:DnaA/Hda family protein [Sphingomonas baiyangensis]TKD51184.1 chromosomal replication initiator DnaA [Sphingomonas baiyangensis]